MKFSILRKLQLFMLGFGIAMGIVFPIYADFFVEWKEGMFIYFVIGCLFAGLIVGLVSFWFVKIILIKKLKEVSNVASDIENNNLTKSIDIKSNDDVGIIVSGLNNSISNIRILFHEMDKTFAISQVALSSVHGSTKEETALQKISDAISNVTENSTEIKKYHESIEKSIEKSLRSTNETIERQKQTISEVESFSGIINSLVNHSKNIAHILKVLEDIAGKTHLLSLNASVEAARAGEVGKGFAVVAGEIRKLATNSSESSQTISQSVKQILNEIATANNQAKVISKSVSQNNKDLISINNQFTDINHTIQSSISSSDELQIAVNKLNNQFMSIQKVFNDLSENLEKVQSIVSSYKY